MALHSGEATMIFWRKKAPQSLHWDQLTPEERVERLLWMASSAIEICKKAIPGNDAQNNFEYVAWNSDSAIRNHLERMALFHRAKNDKAAARAELGATPAFLDHIEDAIAKCNAIGLTEKNFIHVMNLTHALLACFLANDWQRALRLAQAARLPVMQEEGREGESGGVHDEIAKMLVATVLSDNDSFRHVRSRFARDRSFNRFFGVYFNYDHLMELIFEQDSDAFGSALIAHEKSFLKRATDKDTTHGQTLDACLDRNALVFDVRAVALANLARHQGLTVRHTSEIIPVQDFAALPDAQ
jgi:hypothetical protein